MLVASCIPARFETVNLQLRAWSFQNRNQHKRDPRFWWKVNEEFLHELEAIGINSDLYYAFYQYKAKEDADQDVSDDPFELAASW